MYFFLLKRRVVLVFKPKVRELNATSKINDLKLFFFVNKKLDMGNKNDIQSYVHHFNAVLSPKKYYFLLRLAVKCE